MTVDMVSLVLCGIAVFIFGFLTGVTLCVEPRKPSKVD